MRVEVLPITQARIGLLKKSGSVGKCGTGALAGRRRTFRLNKMVLMVTAILPPEGAQRVAGVWRSHRDRNPRLPVK